MTAQDDRKREAEMRAYFTTGLGKVSTENAEAVLRLLDAERKRADELERVSTNRFHEIRALRDERNTAEAWCAVLEAALRHVQTAASEMGHPDTFGIEEGREYILGRIETALAASPEPRNARKERNAS